MSLNWVMLAPNGNPPFHFLPHENLMHQTNKSVALNIESGKVLPAGDDRKKTFSSPAGTVFLTNQRIVFIPEKLSSTAEIQNFAVPIKRVADSHITQPWFAANAFIGTITPVKNGGIPHFAELKFTFKDGGAFEFYHTYTVLLERLHDGQDGAPVDHLEDLPVYSNESTATEEEHGAPVALDEDAPPAYDIVASDDGRTGRLRTRG